MLSLLAQTQARHQRVNSQNNNIKMAFDCPHCVRSYSTKYNLKRHLEQQHNFGSDSSHEYDVDDSPNKAGSVNSAADDSSNESKSGSSDVADSSDESGHLEDDRSSSEENNTYTHNDVCAVLRYFRLQQENEFQKEE